MNKWFIGIVTFVVAYLFFLISQVPAQWVVNQASLPKNVVLQGIEGSVWQATVKKAVIDGYTINHINTDVNLLSLLMFNPSVDATFGGALVNGPEGKATLNHLLGDIEISNTQVSLPANDIAQLLKSELPIPVSAQRYIDLNIETFVMGKPLCQQLSGVVQWEKAGIKALDNKIALGDLKGQLACEKGAIKFTFDPKNNLGLTFTAFVYSPQRISGSGYVQPGSKFPSVLKDALPFIGKADERGRYKVNF